MRLTPPPLEIGETDGFSQNDLFGLAEFGDRLANLVCRLDEPLVVTLDGPWGSGKSTFVQQWAGLLRQRQVPVILFDAFANDHQEDAFISLASEITALAQARAQEHGAAVGDFLNEAKKVGRVLTPLAVKALIRAATLNLLATEDLKGLSADVQDAIKDTAADASAATEQLIEERLKRAEADRDTLEAFRRSLTHLQHLEPSRGAEGRRFPRVRAGSRPRCSAT
ncbi:MAG: p-loop protein [Geminicoccaceae bacterium]|nr:p-loop protein [Geminicoccaceae bacterium]